MRRALLKRFGIEASAPMAMPIEVPDFGRRQLAEMFADLRFCEGVEVGVLFGEYSEILCLANRHLRLRCVDHWRASRCFHDGRLMDQVQFDAWEAEARRRLDPFGAEILKMPSVEAAARIPDRSLDFAYIDADHSFATVAQDLAAWSPKVKIGGIIAGHDYVSMRPPADLRYQGALGCHVIHVLRAWTEAYGIRPWYVLGAKAKVEGQIRDKQRSWCWVVE